MGRHWLIKLPRFQVYNSMIHHLYVALCVYQPRSNLLLPPCIWPFYSLLPLHPFPLITTILLSGFCLSCLFTCCFHFLNPHVSEIICSWLSVLLILLSMTVSISTHVVTNGSISSFLMAQYYSIVCMYLIFFIESSTKRHFSFFCVYLWIMLQYI